VADTAVVIITTVKSVIVSAPCRHNVKLIALVVNAKVLLANACPYLLYPCSQILD
jgi:hypothetical protein